MKYKVKFITLKMEVNKYYLFKDKNKLLMMFIILVE